MWMKNYRRTSTVCPNWHYWKHCPSCLFWSSARLRARSSFVFISHWFLWCVLWLSTLVICLFVFLFVTTIVTSTCWLPTARDANGQRQSGFLRSQINAERCTRAQEKLSVPLRVRWKFLVKFLFQADNLCHQMCLSAPTFYLSAEITRESRRNLCSC